MSLIICICGLIECVLHEPAKDYRLFLKFPLKEYSINKSLVRVLFTREMTLTLTMTRVVGQFLEG